MRADAIPTSVPVTNVTGAIRQASRLTGASFEFEAAEPQLIQVDAEPRPATRKLSVRVSPRSLRLLVPPAAAAQLYLNPRSNA